MAKKIKRTAAPRNQTSARDIDRWLERATRQLVASDYQGVIASVQPILRAPNVSAQQRIEALDRLAAAYSMQQRYPEAYATTTTLLTLQPQEAIYWFNRGMASRLTMRSGQSLRDFERAEELDTTGVLTDKLAKELPFAREMAEDDRARRGPDFTLDQLIKQQELFQQAVETMAEHRWTDAEELLRRVIAMGDPLPQPHGNLGIVLMMQRRFDEAEAALRQALERDSSYAIARQNLAGMPAVRASGVLPQMRINSPFEGRKLNQTLSLLIEEQQPRNHG